MNFKRYCNCMTLFLAVVFLTLPVGMPSARSATLLFSEDFESGTLKAFNDCATTDSNVTQEQVHSGTYAFKFTGKAGGGCTKFLTAEGAGVSTVYLKMLWYFPANFDGTAGPGHHTFRFSHRSGNQYLVNQLDTGIHSNAMDLDIDALWGPETMFWSAVTLPRGQWFKFELLFKLNTIGQSNGTVDVWINGNHDFTASGRDFRGNVTSNIDTFLMTSNYGGATWYLDDVEVWDSCPATGASCSTNGTGATPPPPAPSGLAVR